MPRKPLGDLIAEARRAQRLEAALRRYGEHDENCNTFSRFVEPKCSCGFSAALTETDQREET